MAPARQTPSVEGNPLCPQNVTTEVLGYTLRRRLLYVSATTTVPSGAAATPRGLLNLAFVPIPSCVPIGPAPTTVDTVQIVERDVVTCVDRPGEVHRPGQSHRTEGEVPPVQKAPLGHNTPSGAPLPWGQYHPGEAVQGWQVPASVAPTASLHQPTGQKRGMGDPWGQ